VARWDGTEWHTLGEGGLDWDGVDGELRALAVYEGRVHLGGSFNRAGPVRSVGIARWEGPTGVAIQDFRGWCDAGVVHLQWNLADEALHGDVLVERSRQPEGPYLTLARLPATGGQSMAHSDPSGGGFREWWYRLRVVPDDGDGVSSEPLGISMCATAGPSAIEGIDREGNGVVVRYRIAGSRSVPTTLRIYDVRGRLVEALVSGSKPPGSYVAAWSPRQIARGVFFATLTTNGRAVSRKFVLQHP
jgi:hypothetical protein